MEVNSINIKNIIVHILDNTIQLPVLSQEEHPVNEEIDGFIEKHILKIVKDEGLRDAYFKSEDSKVKRLLGDMASDNAAFARVTGEIAYMLFGIMEKYPDIPPADLVGCLFDLDGIMYFGLLKFNYRHTYIHYISEGPSGRINSIIKQKTTLPGEGQKVEECALINLRDFGVKLLEKKYDINGEKQLYFSSMLLECTSEMSQKEKVKIFKKATESFKKKYCDDDFERSMDIKKAVTDSIGRKDVIDVISVAENVFRRSPDMKDAYIEHIEKAGIKERNISVTTLTAEKAFGRHKLKTDTGVEIQLPVDYYNDKDKIEFINNPDGTISILIKNIGAITDI